MHISDVRKFLRCPRLYQYSLKDNQKSFPYFNININVDESIVDKLRIDNYYLGRVNEDNDNTAEALKEHEWLLRARFTYRGLRCRVPYLYHKDSHCDLYFSSYSVNPTDGEADNIMWTAAVVEKNGLTVDNVYIIYPNKEYERSGELDHDALWNITDHFFNGNGHLTKHILTYIRNKDFDIDGVLDILLHFDSGFEEEAVRTSKCAGRNKCPYYEKCFPEESRVPDNSILTLMGSQYKYEMYRSGIRYLRDVNTDKFEGSQQQFAQIMADRQGGRFFDKLALSDWLKNYSGYPMSFIDFEWDLYLVPPYDGMHPLDVNLFQYSLHIMDEDGTVTHRQFIGERDCREEFLKRMIEDIPDEGVIFAYNARGAEILRLRELQRYFPQYSDRLEGIISRFVDLALPFVNGVVYDVRMRGMYSLKVIQEMLDDQRSYHDLAVENGLDAVAIHRLLEQCDDPETKKKYYEDLYEYCGLDSYAMIEVYNWLISLI